MTDLTKLRDPQQIVQRLISWDGRANRTEFWLVFVVLFIFNGIFSSSFGFAYSSFLFGALYFVVTAVCTYICLATTGRRCHDMNKSAWLSLLLLIPVVNFFAVVYFGTVEGSPAPNQYGLLPG